jgi:hypothetical protein
MLHTLTLAPVEFEIDFLHGTPPFYGSVSRGEICLHLRLDHQPNFAAREVSLILAIVCGGVRAILDFLRHLRVSGT